MSEHTMTATAFLTDNKSVDRHDVVEVPFVWLAEEPGIVAVGIYGWVKSWALRQHKNMDLHVEILEAPLDFAMAMQEQIPMRLAVMVQGDELTVTSDVHPGLPVTWSIKTWYDPPPPRRTWQGDLDAAFDQWKRVQVGHGYDVQVLPDGFTRVGKGPFNYSKPICLKCGVEVEIVQAHLVWHEMQEER